MSSLQEEFKESLNNLNNLKPELLDSLVHEAVRTFHILQEKASSKDPKDLQATLDMANNLKESLEGQMNSILKNLGIDPEELKEFVNNPANFSPEELALMKEVDKQFAEFLPKPKEQRKKKPLKKKRSARAWIPG